jgi:hypothetical protein
LGRERAFALDAAGGDPQHGDARALEPIPDVAERADLCRAAWRLVARVEEHHHRSTLQLGEGVNGAVARGRRQPRRRVADRESGAERFVVLQA